MQWISIAVLVVTLMAVAFKAWFDFHMKFATTPEEAVRNLKKSAAHWGFRMSYWGSIALTVCLLVWQVFSSAPVTRVAVFVIAFQIAVLVVALVMGVIAYSNRRMGEMILSSAKLTAEVSRRLLTTGETLLSTTETAVQHAALTRTLAEVTRAHIEGPKE